MENYLTEYTSYLISEKMRSQNTIDSYISDLKNYFYYLQTKELVDDIELIQLDNIRNYLAYLKKLKYKSRSISRAISSIKSFHKYLVIEDFTKNNPAINIQCPKRDQVLPEVLTVEEMMKILDHLDDSTPINARNQVMIELAYATGMRVSEMCNLKLTDLRLTSSMINVVGKGDKERLIPVNDVCLKLIQKYIKYDREELLKGKHDSKYLFVNAQGGKYSRQSFFILLKKLSKECGITKNISVHTIRHSFATHLLEAGADLRVIKELLGHEDISTTQIYTNISKKAIKETYKKANIRGE